jgi:hypothetical protein
MALRRVLEPQNALPSWRILSGAMLVICVMPVPCPLTAALMVRGCFTAIAPLVSPGVEQAVSDPLGARRIAAGHA